VFSTLGTPSQPSEVAPTNSGSRELVHSSGLLATPPETWLAGLPVGVILRPITKPGEEAPGCAEVEWTLRCLAPLISDWPESPPDLVMALRHYPDSASLAAGVVAGTQPKRGLITANPLYCALWAQPSDLYDTAGRVAQAATLVSAALLAGSPGGLQPFASALGSACLSCRRIGSGTFVPEGLIEGLNSAISLQTVLAALDAAKQSALVLTDEQTRLIGGLHVLLEDALEARQPRKRRGHKGPRPPRRMAGSAEVDDPTPEHQTYEDPTARGPSADDLAEGAAGVREPAARRIATVKVSASVPATSLSPGQLHWRAKYRTRAISTSAQGLLLASDRLQLVDIAAAEQAITDIQTRRWQPQKPVQHGASAVSASLLLGRSVDKLMKLRVVARLDQIPGAIKQPFLAVSDSALVVPAPDLPRSFVPKGDDAAAYRTTSRGLVLRLPDGLSWSRQLLDFGQAHLGKEPFSGPDHASWAEQFAKAVNERAGSRMTTARIAQFLTRQVVAQCGDWADAAILSGSGDANARLYYYTPTHAHLQARYHDLWEGVGKGLGLSIGKSAPAAPPATAVEPGPSQFIGSRGCPTDEAVDAMVPDLIDYCRSMLRGRRSETRYRVVHNAIAMYTCLMVLWHSGMRAVTEPVELDLYDPATGVLGASDKDNDSYYASRVVWLLPLVQRQIQTYWRHLDRLKAELPDSTASLGKGLFLFDSNGEVAAISLQALRNVLPPGYPFRLNAQRHYLRTRLRELGVPAQTIDALLGHGAPGQEPYATHSCYSVQRMRREVEPALRSLSEKAGWVLLHGLA
jgi:hypothetical protein